MWAKFRVPDGVPDVPMAEEILDQPRVQSLVSKHVPGAMPKHMWMDVKSEVGRHRSLTDNPGNHVCADRSAPLANENEWTIAELPQLPQSGNFIAIERVRAVPTTLDPLDVEGLGSGAVQIQLRPA